jgi:hypothetical protein
LAYDIACQAFAFSLTPRRRVCGALYLIQPVDGGGCSACPDVDTDTPSIRTAATTARPPLAPSKKVPTPRRSSTPLQNQAATPMYQPYHSGWYYQYVQQHSGLKMPGGERVSMIQPDHSKHGNARAPPDHPQRGEERSPPHRQPVSPHTTCPLSLSSRRKRTVSRARYPLH